MERVKPASLRAGFKAELRLKKLPNGAGQHAGASQGPGRGGPAKYQRDPSKPQFKRDTPEWKEIRAQKRADVAICYEVIREIMLTGREPMVRLNAAKSLLERLEGMPIARNLNLNTDNIADLSDSEIRAELDRIEQRLRRAVDEVEADDPPPVLH